MTVTFAQLGVPTPICRALESRGITQPFEIQAASIDDAMGGLDICGRAPTGSGKTLAFGIPLVAMTPQAEPRRPRSLVLAPTRELADQIRTELETFNGDVRIGVVYGGVGYGPQLKALRRGVDILVACPGRLEDLLESNELSLDSVDRVVIDEADRMADMGFLPAVRRLLDQTSNERQTILFSATLDGDVAKLTAAYQRDPVRHEVGEESPDITAARHLYWSVSRNERVRTAAGIAGAVWPAIIFCRTRHGADRIARQIGRSGVDTVAIHGNRSQSQRTRALADFASGKAQALVATDVAARGIHVDGVASVIHFDPPEDHKAYIHRSGRTARAGEGGVVVSLVQPEQEKDVRKVQRVVGIEEPITTIDYDALAPFLPGEERRVQRQQVERSATSTRDEATSGGQRNGRKRKPRSPKSSRSSSSASSPQRKDGRSGRGAKESKPADGRRKRRSRTRSRADGAPSKSTKSGTGASSNGGRPNRKARRAHLQPKG